MNNQNMLGNAGIIRERVTQAVAILQEVIDGPQVSVEPQTNGEPATGKQIAYLRNLGVKAPKGLSKQEASALIDEAQAENA